MPKLSSYIEGKKQSQWNELGRLLSQRRTELNLTQTDVATKAGITVQTYSYYELAKSPRMRRTTAASICKALGWVNGDIERFMWSAETPRVDRPVPDSEWDQMRLEVDSLKEQVARILSLLENQD